jgi:DNA-binding NarL/FixJ family response regulator
MPDTIRVAVVDDHPILREGVVHVLSNEPDIEVVASGGSADDALAIAQQHLPDVMVLDMNMPGGGLEGIRRLGEAYPAVRCIILTVREEPDAVSTALLHGARAYVLKGVSGSELVRIVRSVYEGGSFVSTQLAAKLISDLDRGRSGQRPVNSELSSLTQREEQILRLIGRGLSNKEIGLELELKEKTVKHYVTNILQKLHVRNRVEAALLVKSGQS